MHFRCLAVFRLLAAMAGGARPAGGGIQLARWRPQIRGELVNSDESPRKTYVIKTASGGQHDA